MEKVNRNKLIFDEVLLKCYKTVFKENIKWKGVIFFSDLKSSEKKNYVNKKTFNVNVNVSMLNLIN